MVGLKNPRDSSIGTEQAHTKMLTDKDVLELGHELMGSGHWYLDLRDQSLFWSKEVFKIYGCDPNTRQPDIAQAVSFYHPEDRERISTKVDKAIESGEPFSYVARVVRPDGEVRRVRSVGRIKYKNDDQATWLFGVLRDITDEWREQVHRQRLSRIIEQTSEIILMTDREGRIEWANSAFSQVSGYPPKEYLGRKPGDLLQGPDTDADTVAFMRYKLAVKESFTTEVLNYSRNGRPYWLRLSCHADYDEAGAHVGYSSIQNDITEEKSTVLQLEHEVEQRKSLEAKYRYLATHDPLSGLHSRRHFFEQGETELRRCLRYSSSVSMLLVDLDEFKAINDRHGHEAGDMVIQAFGQLCERTLREHDLAARIGGEEFAILLPETPADSAWTLAERLRVALEQLPITTGVGTLHVTASIGVAGAHLQDDTLQSLINRADGAMYEAKRTGRNCVFQVDSG